MKTRIPKTLALVFTAALACAAVFPASARAAIFEPGRITAEAEQYTIDDRNDIFRLSLTPVLVHGNLTAAIGVHMMIDADFRLHDNGNDFLVLEQLVWNRDRLKIEYGDIEGLTLGRGFVVNNYYSNTVNNVPDNETKGIRFETWSDRSNITLFSTLSHLSGGRAERRMGDVALGATFAVDSDPDVEIMGLDAKVNIIPNSWTVYGEYAEIVDAGNGVTVGTAVTPLPKALDLTLVGEWRKFDADFQPGLIDSHYEAKGATPAVSATNPAGKVEGFYLAADYYVSSKNNLKIFYEDYENARARAGLIASAALADRVALHAFYAQENFVPSGNIRREDSVILADLTVALTQNLDLLFDYYRAFDDQRQPLESFGTRVKFHLKR